jgi:glyoxylate reductase
MGRLSRAVDVTLYEGPGAMPRDELLGAVAGKVAAITLLTDRVDDEFLDAAGDQLLIVANYAVGFDNIDVPACSRRGVLASNTPAVLTETTADTAWALMMAAARRIPEGDRLLRSQAPWIWGPLMMLGQDVHGKTLGLVGFGRIGQAMARRARGFGMRVIYFDVLWWTSWTPSTAPWTICWQRRTSSPCTRTSPRRRATSSTTCAYAG